MTKVEVTQSLYAEVFLVLSISRYGQFQISFMSISRMQHMAHGIHLVYQ